MSARTEVMRRKKAARRTVLRGTSGALMGSASGHGKNVMEGILTARTEVMRAPTHAVSGVKLIGLMSIQRWTKRWTCIAMQEPGKARQKFLAT